MHTLPKNILLLAMTMAAMAGCIDAIGFIQLNGFFVSFMSGNSTRLAISVQHGNWSAAVMLLSIIGFFVTGTTLGAIVRNGMPSRYKAPGTLAMVSALLVVAALCDCLGVITASMLLIALAMGAENAVLQGDNTNPIGVTYMTGTLVKMGQHIALALQGGDKLAWLSYLLLWLGLIAGGIAGAFIFMHVGVYALWFPAVWATALTLLLWRKALRNS